QTCALPIYGAAAIAVANFAELEAPGILGGLGMIVAEERDRAARSYDAIEIAQGLAAIHPVKGPADRHQPDRPQIARERERASLPKIEVNARRLRRFSRRIEHVGLGIDRSDPHARLGEGNGKKPRPRAEIEHRI